MAIVATDRGILYFFNDLLHDLVFRVPTGGFEAPGGSLCIDFFNAEKKSAPRYQLCIYGIVDIRNSGRLEELPGYEAMLNVVRFEERGGAKTLTLNCVHTFKLVCTVSELRVSLDQVD